LTCEYFSTHTSYALHIRNRLAHSRQERIDGSVGSVSAAVQRHMPGSLTSQAISEKSSISIALWLYMGAAAETASRIILSMI
jgi:hypothetical protein